jgi:hypothetical protein
MMPSSVERSNLYRFGYVHKEATAVGKWELTQRNSLARNDSAIVTVLDEAFPLEAIHEEADTRPCGADYFGK